MWRKSLLLLLLELLSYSWSRLRAPQSLTRSNGSNAAKTTPKVAFPKKVRSRKA
jgi:hypothetical protein